MTAALIAWRDLVCVEDDIEIYGSTVGATTVTLKAYTSRPRQWILRC
jgi:hypothetical protein